MEIELFDGNVYSRDLLEAEAPNLWNHTTAHGSMFTEEVFLKDICPKPRQFLSLLLASVLYLFLFCANIFDCRNVFCYYFDAILACAAFLNIVLSVPFALRYIMFYDGKYPIRTISIEKGTLKITELGSCETIEHFGALTLKRVSFPNGDTLFSIPLRKRCFLIPVRFGKWVAVGISEKNFEILEEYIHIRA